MKQHFRTTLRTGPNQTWRFLVVPFDVKRVFGAEGVLPVRGSINGHKFRSSIEPLGTGRHYMAVNQELQREANVVNGSEVEVVLDLDLEPRVVSVPAPLRSALEADGEAGRIFRELPLEDQQQFCKWVGEGRQHQTKEQRASKAVYMIRQGHTL